MNMKSKPIKILEIPFSGSYSVKGALYHEIEKKNLTLIDVNEYSWVICVKLMSFDMIKQQCVEMKISNFVIVDRETMIVVGNI